jgi:endonuclease YncB( thermonuclease family)
MKVQKPKRLKADYLRKIGVPGVLIAGMVFASIYGVDKLRNLGPDYHKNVRVFASSGVVRQATDGDTIRLYNGFDYRLTGINAPDRGEPNYVKAAQYLERLVGGKKVYLEYDRYDDDKNGRYLVWVWIGCEANPNFLPADYMHLSYNRSREGLTENPAGCKKGKLVQEEMVKAGMARVELYKDRGELKYQERIQGREKIRAR